MIHPACFWTFLINLCNTKPCLPCYLGPLSLPLLAIWTTLVFLLWILEANSYIQSMKMKLTTRIKPNLTHSIFCSIKKSSGIKKPTLIWQKKHALTLTSAFITEAWMLEDTLKADIRKGTVHCSAAHSKNDESKQVNTSACMQTEHKVHITSPVLQSFINQPCIRPKCTFCQTPMHNPRCKQTYYTLGNVH